MERTATLDLTIRMLNEQLVRGDFFVCASEEQRHLWLGQLSAFGRLNPENYDRDPSLRRLIAVCPFGLPSSPPVSESPAIKGVVDGIGPDDKVVLWAGGIYNWFDPLTAILAIDRLRRDHDDVRMFFLGMTHPNPSVPKMRMAVRAQSWRASWASPTASCSSTRVGLTMPTGSATCSTPTSGSARISSMSRRRPRSARASLTICGRASRS
jgi:hypothetical protein